MIICLKCNSRFYNTNYLCPECGYSPEFQNGIPEFAPHLAMKNEGFRPEYFQDLFDIENKLFWFKYRNNLLQDLLNIYFPNIKNFCEIGCGTGYVLSAFSSKRPEIYYTGSEIYSIALSLSLYRNPSTRFIQADACRLPFEDEFDVTAAFDVLEHIDDDELVLKNMFQATHHHGGIMITVPQHKWLWSKQDEASDHRRRYSLEGLKSKINNAGFTIERMSSFVTLLLPVMLLSRINLRLTKHTVDPMRALKIPRILNSVFYKVCMIEKSLITRGFNLPIGGSLVCIARKI